MIFKCQSNNNKIYYCLFQMNVWFFTFIFWSLMINGTFRLLTSKNVAFQKTNEVFINDAHCSVTFIHDLKPFSNLISKIKNDLAHLE